MTERRRNPLLSFYFSGEEGAGSGRPGGGASGGDPCDINSSSFQPPLWFKQILSDSESAKLVQVDNTLKADVLKLDNSMKTLVYENYNKFISATDTIRDMQSNVGLMEEEMERLAAQMKSIDELTGQVNESLHSRREKVDELMAVHGLLKGRQFLFDLPSRLRLDLQEGEYEDAVHHFQASAPVFQKYSHMHSFASLYEECAATMEEVREQLQSRLQAGVAHSSLEDVASAAQLLKRLGGDAAAIDAHFEAQASAAYEERLSTWEDTVYNDDTSAAQMTVSAFVAALSQYVLPLAQSILRHYSARSFADYLVDSYSARCLVAVSEAEEAPDVLAGLQVMHRYLVELGAPYPDLGLEARASQLLSSACLRYCEQEFSKLQESALASLSQNEEAGVATDAISGDISAFLDVVQAFAETHAATVEYASESVGRLLCELAREASEGPAVVHAKRALYLACLCRTLSLRTVSMAQEGIAGLSMVANVEPSFDALGPQGHLEAAAVLLAERYVVLTARHVGKLMTRSLAAGNWRTLEREPHEPRLVACLVSDELLAAHSALGEAFAEAPGATEAPPPAQRKPSSYLRDQVAPLYRQTVTVFEEIKLTRDSVFSCVCRAFLKEWSEVARHFTFNVKGLHQLQVDIAYVGSCMRPLLSTRSIKSIEALIELVTRSVLDRSLKHEPLEDSVVTSLVNKKKKEVGK